MAVRSLRSFFHTAYELPAADLPSLGEALLMHLNSYEDRVKQHGPWLITPHKRASVWESTFHFSRLVELPRSARLQFGTDPNN